MAVLLSLGSINADFQVRVDASPSGPGALAARDLLRTSGGKAANVAVLAARLGASARLLGCVGDDDLADQALAGPRRAGVDVSGVRRVQGATGYSSILVPPDGAKTIVLATNANDAWADEADAVAAEVAAAPGGSLLVADLEVPPAVVEAAVRAARERGFPVVLDPAPPERVHQGLLRLADHVAPDAAEAATLTGADTGSEAAARGAAEALRDRGPGAAYVKLSSGGCVVASEHGVHVVRAPAAVPVVDQTGAGDAFAGALAWALLQGRGLTAAAHAAVAASTCSVSTYGSQESYPTPGELAAMIARVEEATDRPG